MIETGTSTLVRYVTEGMWKGKPVEVVSTEPCPVPGHDLDVMNHYGVPTEHLMCYECIGTADNPDASALLAEWHAAHPNFNWDTYMQELAREYPWVFRPKG